MMSNKYKFLVASDMDYTLLMPGRPVSERNVQAVRKIREAGGAFTLATGRSSYITGIYTKALNVDVPVITSNGAAIWDPVKRQDLFTSNIPREIVLKLMRSFIENGTNATGYSPDGIFYLPGSGRRRFIEDYNRGLPDDEKAITGEISEEMVEAAEQAKLQLPEFNKFLLIKSDEFSLNLVRSIDELDIVSSAGDFHDVMNKGISKGDALLKIASMLDVPHDRVIAFGDSENDLSMIEASGIGIAMENSDPRLLSAADHVTGTCEEDGFADGVEWVLEKIQGDYCMNIFI